jgi:hypothetical protein
VWWHILVILTLGRLRQEDQKFEISLGFIVNKRNHPVVESRDLESMEDTVQNLSSLPLMTLQEGQVFPEPGNLPLSHSSPEHQLAWEVVGSSHKGLRG